MRVITNAKPMRLDVHPAKIEHAELPHGGLHFEFADGRCVTLSVNAMRQLMRSVEIWGSALVEISERDPVLIGKGVCNSDEYPKAETVANTTVCELGENCRCAEGDEPGCWNWIGKGGL